MADIPNANYVTTCTFWGKKKGNESVTVMKVPPSFVSLMRQMASVNRQTKPLSLIIIERDAANEGWQKRSLLISARQKRYFNSMDVTQKRTKEENLLPFK